MTTPAIEARDIRKTYRGSDTPALDDFSLLVKRGVVCALLGSNGAGKTTAVRVLATLLAMDAGQASVAGHDVATDADRVRRAVGLVGQYAAVDEILSGRKNLVLFARLNGLTRRAARGRATELIELFGLEDAADRSVGGYSGGMRRRLDLAASLVVTPPVLFLDEPTAGLDPDGRRDMWAAVRTLVEDGTTVLLTTQYLEEADALADHVAMLRDGRVVLEGSPDELKSLVGDTWLDLTLMSEQHAADAAQMARAFAATAADLVSTGTTVAVPMTGRASITRLCGVLANAGIEPVDIAIRRPSLDDVFVNVNRLDKEQLTDSLEGWQ